MSLRHVLPGEVAFDALKQALEDANLPTSDLLDDAASYFTWKDARGVAFAGLLPLGEDALLRSVTVPGSERGTGLGRTIVSAVAEGATAAGTKRLWLLTTSAAEFFQTLGWQAVDRTSAPAHVTASRQFSSVCPGSATLMMRRLV